MGEEGQVVAPLAPESVELAPPPLVETLEVETETAEKPTFEKVVEEAVLVAEQKPTEDVEGMAEPEEGTAEPEEKTVETVGETTETRVHAEEPAVLFKEESYYVRDLKEQERKALEELKAKIEEAIKANTFLAVPKQEELSKDVEVEKKEEGEKPKEETVLEGEAVVGTVAAEAMEEPKPSEEEQLPAGETVIQPEEEIAKELPEEAPLPVVDEAPVEPPPQEVELEKTTPELDDSPPLDDLALWGVPLLHSKGDERTDVILLKFLRAREFKVNDAFSMLKDTLIWRKDFMADSLVDEDALAEFDSVAYMHGLDKQGHPVCYNHYGVFQAKDLYQKTFEDESQFKNFLRWRIQVLEKGIQKLDFSPSGVNSIVQITDFKDSPGFVKWMNIMRKPLNLLQDNYPELVAKQIFINVPWYFGALYPMFGKRLTPRSKSKVVVARPGKVTETLFKYISPEYVPVHYGGLSRTNDSEFEGVVAPVKEVMVKAGEKQTIELPVAESGSTVVWDVGVVGWEVVYGEEFVPSGEGSYTVIIQKSKKVASSEEPMRNSFKATEPGKVVLTIDNTASRRKRVVVYRFFVKETAVPVLSTVDAE